MMLDHRERERIRRYHFSLPSVSVRYVSRPFMFEFHFSSCSLHCNWQSVPQSNSSVIKTFLDLSELCNFVFKPNLKIAPIYWFIW